MTATTKWTGWLLPAVILGGCIAPKAQLTSAAPQNDGDEARAAMRRIRTQATAEEVALTDAEREKYFRRVEKDTIEHPDNTMLLIRIAYLNPDEKRKLVEKLPTWFASSNLSTRCMAFNVVKFLKVPGFEEEATVLHSDLKDKRNLSPIGEMVRDDMRTHVRSAS